MLDFQENILLKNYTSLKVGGPAEFFFQPAHIEELKTALVWARLHSHAVTLLGGGTNTLVSDEGVKGLVLCMRKFVGLESRIENRNVHIAAKSGTPKTLLLKEFLKYKLAPAEFLAGLPGDVAGGVVMNAGIGEKIVPHEFCEIVEWVEILRPSQKIERIERSHLEFSYRKSKGWQPGIIVNIGFVWPHQEDPHVMDRVKILNRSRLSKQPLELPNAGSVFVNPPGYKSGQLIESCGLKGYRVGDAMISDKHANFIVNVGEAKASDVLQLIKHVQQTVLEHKGVSLHPEWCLVGF